MPPVSRALTDERARDVKKAYDAGVFAGTVAGAEVPDYRLEVTYGEQTFTVADR